MTIQNSREMMFRTSPSAMQVDGDFFRKIDAKADKLGSSGHPADWRRLRQEVGGWLENHVKKEPFNAADQGAYEHAMARLDFIDSKISIHDTALASRGTSANASASGDPHTDVFNNWLRAPHNSAAQAALTVAEQDARGFRAEGNTLTGAAGGFAVPEPVADMIRERIKEISPLRQLAANYQVTSTGTKFLVNRNNAASAWVGETDTRAGTAEPTLDNRAPSYGTVYGLVEATEELLLDSAVNIGQWFSNSVVQQIAQAEGAAFVSGNGTSKPTGFLAGPTPVTTGDATRASGTLQYTPSVGTDPTAAGFGNAMLDALTNVFFATKAMHRTAGVWLMNSAVASIVAKIRDGEGRHIWQQALAADIPNTLLGRPVFFAEDMQNWGANNFPIAFGNFAAGYLITDSGDLRVTVDDNITKPGYVRWYIRRRVGGVIYDSEAIKLLKVATT